MSHLPKLEGKRILLRGFEGPEEIQANLFMSEAGGTLVQSLQAADLVIIGPAGAPKVASLAHQRQLQVVPWIEIDSLKAKSPIQQSSAPVDKLAVEIHSDFIRILDVQVPQSHRQITPILNQSRFNNICMDEPFLRAARAVALGVPEKLPTALEGPTAASKTTVVLWLAHLLRQPVLRLNLNGQTDTGELIGRFVPARGDDSWDVSTLAALAEFLLPMTRTLLEKTLRENRPLSETERLIISSKEGFREQRWRFAEEIIPHSLRSGSWILLDELNLAEPQILERLNPVLETPPSLLLSEGDLTRWGIGGLPIHPDFRLFATLNPAEYSGRSIMSPAFRDRWIQWFHTAGPSENEYTAQLKFLVHGTHPQITIGPTCYRSLDTQPLFPQLAEISGINEIIPALGRFHTAMAMAGGEGGRAPSLGRNRRERPAFTRRSLEACARLWCALRQQSPTTCHRSQLAKVLSTIYWTKLTPGADRKGVMGMAQVAGLPLEQSL